MDVSALNQFYSAMKPIMDAIPAVLEMVEQQADMERAASVYRAEVESIKASGKDAQDAVDNAVTALKIELADLEEQKQTVLRGIAAAEEAVKAAKAASQDAINTAKYAADAAIVQHKARASAAEFDANERVSAAEATATERAAELEKSIADLEKREAAAQASLEALRAKLG